MIIMFHVQQLFFALFILTVNCIFVIYHNFSNIEISFHNRGILLDFKDTNANEEINASTGYLLIGYCLFMLEL